MKRLTAIEKSAIALALAFIIGGVIMIVHPVEMTVLSDSYTPKVKADPKPQFISKSGCQVSGGIAVTVGLGIGCLALYRGRR